MDSIESKYRKLQHDNLMGVTQIIEKQLLITVKFKKEVNEDRAEATMEHVREHLRKIIEQDRDVQHLGISNELHAPNDFMDVSVDIDKEERIEDTLKVGFGVPVYTCNLCGGKRYFVRKEQDTYVIVSRCQCIAGKAFGVGDMTIDRDVVALWLQVHNLTLDWLKSKQEKVLK